MNNVILKTNPFKLVAGTSETCLTNGVHKPIIFEFMRQDVKGMTFTNNGGFIEINNFLPDVFPDTEINVGDFVNIYYLSGYDIEATKLVEITLVNSTLGNVTSLETNEPFVSIGLNAGCMNFVRENWYLQTSIKAIPLKESVERVVSTIESKADENLLISVNVAPFLKNLVSMQDKFDYLFDGTINREVSYLYRLNFNSFWSEGDGITIQGIDEADFYQYLNGVKPILSNYGNNFADFLLTTQIEEQKLFISQSFYDYSNKNVASNYYYGYPTTFGTIMTTDALYLKKLSIQIFDINGNLLNDNLETFSISEIYHTINIKKSKFTAFPTADYFILSMKYQEIANPSNVLNASLDYRFDVRRDCVENPIYINWLDSNGGRNYWLFEKNQVLTMDADTNSDFKPYFSDLETQNIDTQELNVSANEVVSVGGVCTLEKWQYLKTLFHSINVNVLTNFGQWETDGAKWKVVRIQKGSLSNWETKNKNVEFSFKIQTESINIQSE
jgi:hypothetical protein